MNKFFIKIILKDTDLSGYTWLNNKPSWLGAYIEIEAETLKDAVDIVLEQYSDKKKYWVKVDESYMLLKK